MYNIVLIYKERETTLSIVSIIKLMRPHQYSKNLLIFLPLFFALKITNIDLLLNAAIAFIAFSLTASAIYILNDYHDIKEDRQHPKKKNRPLASGDISNSQAIIIMSVLFISGFSLIATLSLEATTLLSVYVVLNIAYSYFLKHIAIVDVVIIAIGFVIRILVGTTVTMLNTSMWIVVMTFLLALFLALSKRRDDVLLFNQTGKKMRKVIDGYNLQFVDISMTLMSGVVIVSYLMYCVSPNVIERIGSDKLYLTSLFVIIGIMRYMQITFVEENSGSPTKILFQDRLIQIVIVLWISSFAIILY